MKKVLYTNCGPNAFMTGNGYKIFRCSVSATADECSITEKYLENYTEVRDENTPVRYRYTKHPELKGGYIYLKQEASGLCYATNRAGNYFSQALIDCGSEYVVPANVFRINGMFFPKPQPNEIDGSSRPTPLGDYPDLSYVKPDRTFLVSNLKNAKIVNILDSLIGAACECLNSDRRMIVISKPNTITGLIRLISMALPKQYLRDLTFNSFVENIEEETDKILGVVSGTVSVGNYFNNENYIIFDLTDMVHPKTNYKGGKAGDYINKFLAKYSLQEIDELVSYIEARLSEYDYLTSSGDRDYVDILNSLAYLYSFERLNSDSKQAEILAVFAEVKDALDKYHNKDIVGRIVKHASRMMGYCDEGTENLIKGDGLFSEQIRKLYSREVQGIYELMYQEAYNYGKIPQVLEKLKKNPLETDVAFSVIFNRDKEGKDFLELSLDNIKQLWLCILKKPKKKVEQDISEGKVKKGKAAEENKQNTPTEDEKPYMSEEIASQTFAALLLYFDTYSNDLETFRVFKKRVQYYIENDYSFTDKNFLLLVTAVYRNEQLGSDQIVSSNQKVIGESNAAIIKLLTALGEKELLTEQNIGIFTDYISKYSIYYSKKENLLYVNTNLYQSLIKVFKQKWFTDAVRQKFTDVIIESENRIFNIYFGCERFDIFDILLPCNNDLFGNRVKEENGKFLEGCFKIISDTYMANWNDRQTISKVENAVMYILDANINVDISAKTEPLCRLPFPESLKKQAMNKVTSPILEKYRNNYSEAFDYIYKEMGEEEVYNMVRYAADLTENAYIYNDNLGADYRKVVEVAITFFEADCFPELSQDKADELLAEILFGRFDLSTHKWYGLDQLELKLNEITKRYKLKFGKKKEQLLKKFTVVLLDRLVKYIVYSREKHGRDFIRMYEVELAITRKVRRFIVKNIGLFDKKDVTYWKLAYLETFDSKDQQKAEEKVTGNKDKIEVKSGDFKKLFEYLKLIEQK